MLNTLAVMQDIADQQYAQSVNKRVMSALAMNLYSHLQHSQAQTALTAWQQRHNIAIGVDALMQHKTHQLRQQKLTAMQQHFTAGVITRNVFHFWKAKQTILSTLRRVTVTAQLYHVIQQWRDNSTQLQLRVDTMSALAVQRNNSLLMSQAYNQWKCTFMLLRKLKDLRKHSEAARRSSLKHRCFMQLKRAVEQRKGRVKQARVLMYTALLKQQVSCIRTWHEFVQQRKRLVLQTEQWQHRQLYLHQHNALQQWYRVVTAKKARQTNYDTVKLKHNNLVKADTITFAEGVYASACTGIAVQRTTQRRKTAQCIHTVDGILPKCEKARCSV